MTYFQFALAVIANGLAIVGVAYAVRSLRRTRAAEDAWIRAVHAHAATQALLKDIGEEAVTLRGNERLSDGLRQMYLEEAVANIVRDLAARRELSETALAGIERGLKQPSVIGRHNYARKLVQEGLSGHVSPVR